MSKIDIQSFKDRIDLIQLIQQDEPIKNNFGAHSSKHDSKNKKCLSLDPEKQIWHCFSCGAGGDVISWVQDRDGKNFMEAVDWLADHYNLPHPTLNQQQWQKHQAQRSEVELVRPILKDAFQFYHDQLGFDQNLYFRQRGIAPETMQNLLLGYAPKTESNRALYQHLCQFYDDALLLKSGLFFQNRRGITDLYQDRYIFPYW